MKTDTREDIKYAGELYFLLKFLSSNPSLPFGKSDLLEKSKNQIIDFVFSSGNKLYGVEMVRLWDKQKDISARIPFIENILEKAGKEYIAEGNKALFINFSISEANIPLKPTKKQKEEIYKAILKEVRPYKNILIQTYVEDNKINSKYIIDMMISPAKDENNWLMGDCFTLEKNKFELLQNTIDEKKEKYNNYIQENNYEKIYLLVITHTGLRQDRFVFNNAVLEKNFLSPFDKVFLFDSHSKNYFDLHIYKDLIMKISCFLVCFFSWCKNCANTFFTRRKKQKTTCIFHNNFK